LFRSMRLQGQRDVECRAGTSVWRGPQPAAVHLDDYSAHRQADTHPLGSRRDERPEHPLRILAIEALPAVDYGRMDGAASLDRRTDLQNHLAPCHAHRLDG